MKEGVGEVEGAGVLLPSLCTDVSVCVCASVSGAEVGVVERGWVRIVDWWGWREGEDGVVKDMSLRSGGDDSSDGHSQKLSLMSYFTEDVADIRLFENFQPGTQGLMTDCRCVPSPPLLGGVGGNARSPLSNKYPSAPRPAPICRYRSSSWRWWSGTDSGVCGEAIFKRHSPPSLRSIPAVGGGEQDR